MPVNLQLHQANLNSVYWPESVADHQLPGPEKDKQNVSQKG